MKLAAEGDLGGSGKVADVVSVRIGAEVAVYDAEVVAGKGQGLVLGERLDEAPLCAAQLEDAVATALLGQAVETEALEEASARAPARRP